jgi:hypothetical protein
MRIVEYLPHSQVVTTSNAQNQALSVYDEPCYVLTTDGSSFATHTKGVSLPCQSPLAEPHRALFATLHIFPQFRLFKLAKRLIRADCFDPLRGYAE